MGTLVSFVAVVTTVASSCLNAATSSPACHANDLAGVDCSDTPLHEVNLLQATTGLMPASSSLKCLEGDWPDVGPPYRDDQAARLDWLLQNRRESLPGCTDGHAEEKEKPLREVLAPGDDGYCHFNFMVRCPAAVRMRDYMPFAVADATVVRSELKWLACPAGYEDGSLKTAPGAWIVDAQLCHATGFLRAPRELLYNFSALTDYAEQRCQEFKAEFPVDASLDYHTMTRDYSKSQTGLMTAEEWRWHEMSKCLLWEPHGLACDISFCLYNMCLLPDGRVGQGLQCHDDFLSEEVMEKYGHAIKREE